MGNFSVWEQSGCGTDWPEMMWSLQPRDLEMAGRGSVQHNLTSELTLLWAGGWTRDFLMLFPFWNDRVTQWMPSVLVWSSRSRPDFRTLVSEMHSLTACTLQNLLLFFVDEDPNSLFPLLGKKSRSWQHLLVIASLSCFSLVLLVSVSGPINIRNFCVFTIL